MELRRRAELVATSRADELSLRALLDVATVTDADDARIVGGQMTALLLTAFPVPGIPARRTRDADTAITTALAGSGVLHDRLTALGYAATAGNSYSRPVPELAEPDEEPPELSVDLLVPSFDGRFRRSSHGGRAFDAVPGLGLALAIPPITIDVGATLLDGSLVEFVVHVPTVEVAVIVKAHAWASRLQPRDIEDIYRLMEIIDAYPASDIGGWQLDQEGLRASRRDAATHLHGLGRRPRRPDEADVPAARLAALIAAHVARPD